MAAPNLISAPPDYQEITVEGLAGLYCGQHADPATVLVTRWPCDQHGPAATIEEPA